MNLQDFLRQIVDKVLLSEATGTLSDKKDRAKSSTGDAKARDAARKRAERARATPREKKSQQELIKDVVLVRTKSGNIQLIFKDSFNASYHQKLNKNELSVDEAKRITQEDKFEQTRASKLLFGDVKAKETSKEVTKKKAEEKKDREAATPKAPEKREKQEKTKAKKLSREQMFQTMSQMTPEQLVGMPPELRNEYFKMMRRPTPNGDFDQMSYEKVTVAFGLSDISGLPYNQQVMNALVFLAKLKAGASDQELQTYFSLAPQSKDFTRAAFFSAKKILSQLGDQCIQSLLTNVETTGKPTNSEGATDMECGEYRFKISAGGEVSFSTNDFTQSNKNFKGLVGKALTQAFMDPKVAAADPKLSEYIQSISQEKSKFSTTLVPDEIVAQIKNDPKLMAKLQQTPIKDAQGNDLGMVIDADGNLNPMASINNYRKMWEDGASDLMKGGKDKILKKYMASALLKTMIRGDGLVDPQTAPNHLVTVNGILPLSDAYFDEIADSAVVDVKKAKDVITASNIAKYKPGAAERLKAFTTVVEATEYEENPEEETENTEKEEKPTKKQSKGDLGGIMVDINQIDPVSLMVNYITRNNDFLLNASLLPGFKPSDLNAVQYNYITVGNKTIKIPVIKDDNVTNQVLGECSLFINDMLVESLSNNFVLAELVKTGIIYPEEGTLLYYSQNLLTENSEYVMINMKSIFENAVERISNNPNLINDFVEALVAEEYKRNYAQEYRNYHGKPKQRRERAARTKAREQMIKKGRAKKGDGKDIDHKKAIRNGGSYGINNLRVRDRSANRSDNGHHEGEKQNKDWK